MRPGVSRPFERSALPLLQFHVTVLVLLAATAGAGIVSPHFLSDVADRLGLLGLAAGVRLHRRFRVLRLAGLLRRDRRLVRRPSAGPERSLGFLVPHLLDAEDRLGDAVAN